MVITDIKDLSLRYPVYSNVSRSLKKHVINKFVGGNIKSENGLYFVDALKNINITFESGDRVGLIGHNGSGKTTMLRLVAGLLEPTTGTISTKGKINSLIEIHYGMNYEATGYENIKIRCVLLGITLKKLNHIINKIIDFSELGNYIYMPVKTYSSGMMMRLSFSIMSIIDSDIFLLDEWLSVGDESFKEKANNEIIRLINNSSLFIFSSHDKSLIDKLCNRNVILSQGEIVQDSK